VEDKEEHDESHPMAIPALASRSPNLVHTPKIHSILSSVIKRHQIKTLRLILVLP
jgi:hypothetical protein